MTLIITKKSKIYYRLQNRKYFYVFTAKNRLTLLTFHYEAKEIEV